MKIVEASLADDTYIGVQVTAHTHTHARMHARTHTHTHTHTHTPVSALDAHLISQDACLKGLLYAAEDSESIIVSKVGQFLSNYLLQQLQQFEGLAALFMHTSYSSHSCT